MVYQNKDDFKKKSSQLRYAGEKDLDIYSQVSVVPGVIRISDAPRYLGMNKNIFRKEVSPFLTKFPIGSNGIGIDRAELDLWIAYMKVTKGVRKAIPPWETKEERHTPTISPTRASPHYSHSQGIVEFQKMIKKITSKK